ncbi:SpaA isopeptide-forming pilin-related protein [Neobacillus sp. WH10]|uniref:SpaA isopeptide-forming pilin-related protein n=1 Tax=Neobacillus sp. WH10 TaxID=3047873 RepID=UPI0024C1A98B|nr:SpaA isopeptide-forming pilin-related protein [Neobacillus sp. WH10]WHY77368.1 SpaA isopeptide-forming pilin-related protein [Neobacillus sp. WH10]
MAGAVRHNKVFSVVFTIVSIFMLFLSMVFPHIKASAEVLTHEKYNNKGWVFSKHLGFFIETDIIRLSDGRIAYCLDERLSSPNGHDLEPNGRLSDKAYRVMAYGYPEKTPEQLGAANWQEAHFGTQIALWVVNTNINYEDLRFDNANVKAVVDRILNDVRTQETTQDLYFEVSPTSNVAKVEGDFFKAGAFKVTTNAKGTYTPEAINAPEGTYFANANGEKKTTFNNDEDFYVYFNKNVASGSFNIKVTGDLFKTETIWYKSYDEGIQNAMSLGVVKNTPVQDNLSVNWISKGSLELVKVNENGQRLAGAKFDVKNAKGETVATITTDENGYAKVDNLNLGVYTIVETEAPTGFVLDQKEIAFEVKEDGQVIKLEATNKKITGTLEITKVDVVGSKPLPNAKFEIFDENGNKVVEKVTDENGKAIFEKLPFGKYTFKETVAPDGYLINETVVPFEIKENGEVIKHTVSDERIPTPEKPEQPKPEKSLPQTGGQEDNTMKYAGLGAAATALIGLAYVVARRKEI